MRAYPVHSGETAYVKVLLKVTHTNTILYSKQSIKLIVNLIFITTCKVAIKSGVYPLDH